MSGRYPSKAVANWWIDRFSRSGGRRLTQLQLNKLVYIAHGWHLAMDERSDGLIAETIVAWKHGPVVPSLRDEFREFGSRPITSPASDWIGGDDVFIPKLADYDVQSWEKRALEWVYDRYGHMSGPQLITVTHRNGSPWWEVTRGGVDIGRNGPIPNDMIREYYGNMLKKLEHPLQ